MENYAGFLCCTRTSLFVSRLLIKQTLHLTYSIKGSGNTCLAYD